jgi:hypothetical protein
MKQQCQIAGNTKSDCFILRTKNGYVTKSGSARRDINNGDTATFSTAEKAQEFRDNYVSPKWDVMIEGL